MKKAQATVGSKILGYTILILVSFAVLFDPTEMALGSKYVELSAGWLSFAEVVGNVTWVAGVLYMIVAFGGAVIIFSEEALNSSLKNVKSWKAYKPKWYGGLSMLFGIGMSLIALGSGFWFTGAMWLLALIMLKGMMSRFRSTKEYKEWIKAHK